MIIVVLIFDDSVFLGLIIEPTAKKLCLI